MVGRIYVRAPVSSNMITTTVTVIRITPLERIQPMLSYIVDELTQEQPLRREMHKYPV